jgi:hypothetical protein
MKKLPLWCKLTADVTAESSAFAESSTFYVAVELQRIC